LGALRSENANGAGCNAPYRSRTMVFPELSRAMGGPSSKGPVKPPETLKTLRQLPPLYVSGSEAALFFVPPFFREKKTHRRRPP